MAILAIDHIVVAVPSVEDAATPWERLGLTLTPRMEHAGAGTANRVFMVGDGPENAFYVELLEVHDASLATASGLDHYEQVAAAGGGLARVMLAVDGLEPVAAALGDAGVATATRDVRRDDGSPIGVVLMPIDATPAGVEIGFIAYELDAAARFESRRQRGLFDHTLPLKRLDHLAVIPDDAAEAADFWATVLGVPVAGEVTSPTTVIQQLRIGDAVIELLSAASPDSPFTSRPRGPISMAAFEVPDIDAAVALARERGFSPPDPRPGALPGTHTATIPATECGGLALQLLQYV